MSLAGNHLGKSVSALLDGQMPVEQAEQAWLHVHNCSQCHDQVQRELWIKRRLAGLSMDTCASASHDLKHHLRDTCELTSTGSWVIDRPRRSHTMVAVSSSALGAAVLGVLAMSTAPAAAPTTDRRPGVVSFTGTESGATSLRNVSAP